MSLIFATQLTAAATAVLAVFAIVTGIYAIRAFRKQSKEVSDQASMLEIQSEQLAEQRKVNAEQTKVLALQASELRESLEERTRDTAERRRAQASRVFIWTELGLDPGWTQAQRASGMFAPEAVIAHIKNTSEQPVYDLTISWHKGTAPWGEPDHILVLMPGDQKDRVHSMDPDLPSNVDRSVFGAVARFRDAAGAHWRLRPGGQLDEEPVTG